ncbi:hypothetical protein [Clostridium tetani]|uniref:hypothetical protein n=1 Tax=Clostridium tetani TaxID=1513 RepID=UPI0003C0D817|nr:hypothetical protein [Clostridium tetani]CDI50315.1 hypothetical protein BN906_02331 [Clostridium tetani 12124569]
MVYTVILELSEDIKENLMFSFYDINEMEQFLKLYFKSRNEIVSVWIDVDEI